MIVKLHKNTIKATEVSYNVISNTDCTIITMPLITLYIIHLDVDHRRFVAETLSNFTAQYIMIIVQSGYCDRMSSVFPSATLVDCDHIGWKSWKLIATDS